MKCVHLWHLLSWFFTHVFSSRPFSRLQDRQVQDEWGFGDNILVHPCDMISMRKPSYSFSEWHIPTCSCSSIYCIKSSSNKFLKVRCIFIQLLDAFGTRISLYSCYTWYPFISVPLSRARGFIQLGTRSQMRPPHERPCLIVWQPLMTVPPKIVRSWCLEES